MFPLVWSSAWEASLETVEIRWHPAFELWLSSYTFKNRNIHKTLDLGPDWVRQVQEEVTPELRQRIEKARDSASVILPLIWEFKGREGITGFLQWLGSLSPGDLYEILQPWLHASRPAARLSILSDLGGERDELLEILQEWNDQYFKKVNPTILARLGEEADKYQGLRRKLSAVEIVDQATGIDYSRVRDVPTVYLVPQYHASPWNVYEQVQPGVFYLFPVDAAPTEPGQPPAALVRLGKALSDETRLRILRYLASGPKRFVQIMDHLGLPKSTTHSDIVLLRAARLVRLACEDGVDVYVLRPGALAEISNLLSKYVDEEEDVEGARQA